MIPPPPPSLNLEIKKIQSAFPQAVAVVGLPIYMSAYSLFQATSQNTVNYCIVLYLQPV